MPKSFMVKNSKRWIPSRESREKDVRAAIALGMFFSLLKFFGFLNKCLTVFYSKKNLTLYRRNKTNFRIS